jgi:hypothetical protein
VVGAARQALAFEAMSTVTERRERFGWMANLEDDADVEHIPLAEPGTNLADGDQYVDATSPKRGTVTSLEGEFVPVGGVYIVRSATDPALWEKITAAIR